MSSLYGSGFRTGREEAFRECIEIARANNDEATLSELFSIMKAEFGIECPEKESFGGRASGGKYVARFIPSKAVHHMCWCLSYSLNGVWRGWVMAGIPSSTNKGLSLVGFNSGSCAVSAANPAIAAFSPPSDTKGPKEVSCAVSAIICANSAATGAGAGAGEKASPDQGRT